MKLLQNMSGRPAPAGRFLLCGLWSGFTFTFFYDIHQLVFDRVVWTDECHVLLAGDGFVTTQSGELSTATITLSYIDLCMGNTPIIICDGN